LPVGLLVFGAFLLFGFSPGAFGIHLAVVASVVRFAIARENSRAKRVSRHIQVAADGVRADGELLPRKLIAEGYYQPRPTGATVRLFDRHKRIVFEARVDTEEQAQEILRALGLDASQKRTEFRVVSPVAARQDLSLAAAGAILAILAANIGWLHAGPGVFLTALALVSFLSLWPTKVVVGVDGVLVSWLWRKQFIPMAEIVAVSADGSNRILLERSGGRREIIAVGSHKARGGVHTERRDLVLARIREAWQSHRSRKTGADVATIVARGERTLDDWKRALATLESGDAGYRQAALREEDLWRLVEDPRAGEDARAAAALLLRKGLDEPGRARVRVAAEATASPKLRIAFEAATAPDDEAAFAALDEVKPPRAASFEDR
jgi:hypothetical protein